MSVRSDITVEWLSSPRIITVAAPSVELDIQDLIDTLRHLEYMEPTKSYPKLVDAAGKEPLGGGVYVGITLTLLNAKVLFEDRAGPTYEQCNISGGNLVAFDDLGAEMSPIQVSSFTQIVRTSSSSATLQELEAIQYSSFGGGVTIDIINGQSGTLFPIGTAEYPVDNIQDATAIASIRGFHIIYVIGDITLGTGDDVEEHCLIGQNPVKTTIMIGTDALTQGVGFRNATVEGVLDGNSWIRDCSIGDLLYVDGHIEDSGLTGTITLGTVSDTFLINCYCGKGDIDAPIIDFDGVGSNFATRGYNGCLELRNLTSDQDVTLNIDSGHITLDSTITNGTIRITGVTSVIDNSGPGASVTYEGALNVDLISSDVWAHSGADAMTLLLNRILGLVQENYYLDQTTYTTYSGAKLLTEARLRTYTDAVSVGTDDNVLAYYRIVATWVDDEMTDYQVTRYDPTEVASLSISITYNTTDIELSWGSIDEATSYNIYRGTAPYFTPGAVYQNVADLSYDDAGARGSTSTNYFYIVRPVFGGVDEGVNSNRVGEIDVEIRVPESGQESTLSQWFHIALEIDGVSTVSQLSNHMVASGVQIMEHYWWDADLQQFASESAAASTPIALGECLAWRMNVGSTAVGYLTFVGGVPDPYAYDYTIIPGNGGDMDNIVGLPAWKLDACPTADRLGHDAAGTTEVRTYDVANQIWVWRNVGALFGTADYDLQFGLAYILNSKSYASIVWPNDWWNLSARTVHGAYRAILTSVASLTLWDLSGNGNHLTIGVMPDHSAASGWMMDGGTHYLITNFVPEQDQSQAVLVEYKYAGENSGRLLGAYDTEGLAIQPNIMGIFAIFQHGSSMVMGNPDTGGNAGVAGDRAYQDGVAVGDALLPYASAPTLVLYVGCFNDDGSPGGYTDAYIESLVIYSDTPSGAEMSTVATAMGALS